MPTSPSLPASPSRSRRRAAASLLPLAGALVLFVAACGGGSTSSKPASSGGGGSQVSGVVSLGPESGAQRLAAARAAGSNPPVVINLTSDQQAPLAQWPDACSLLTTAQVKAIVPGNYTPKAVGSQSMVKPEGTGTLAHNDQCDWQLGGGANGSVITVNLDSENPPAVQITTPSAGQTELNPAPGITCQNESGIVQCEHQVWAYSVAGHVAHPDGSEDADSRGLVSQWLTPVMVLVGDELQGSAS